jgi:DNA repair ATPase RecN
MAEDVRLHAAVNLLERMVDQQTQLNALLLEVMTHLADIQPLDKSLKEFAASVVVLAAQHEERLAKLQEVLDTLAENETHLTGITGMLTRLWERHA